jgi:hypothetical protein
MRSQAWVRVFLVYIKDVYRSDSAMRRCIDVSLNLRTCYLSVQDRFINPFRTAERALPREGRVFPGTVAFNAGIIWKTWINRWHDGSLRAVSQNICRPSNRSYCSIGTIRLKGAENNSWVPCTVHCCSFLTKYYCVVYNRSISGHMRS